MFACTNAGIAGQWTVDANRVVKDFNNNVDPNYHTLADVIKYGLPKPGDTVLVMDGNYTASEIDWPPNYGGTDDANRITITGDANGSMALFQLGWRRFYFKSLF